MVEGIAELIWLLMFAAVCSAREGGGEEEEEEEEGDVAILGVRYSVFRNGFILGVDEGEASSGVGHTGR
jgi:hypothetical protein